MMEKATEPAMDEVPPNADTPEPHDVQPELESGAAEDQSTDREQSKVAAEPETELSEKQEAEAEAEALAETEPKTKTDRDSETESSDTDDDSDSSSGSSTSSDSSTESAHEWQEVAEGSVPTERSANESGCSMTEACHEAIYLEERLAHAERVSERYPKNSPQGKKLRHNHLMFVLKIYITAVILLMLLLYQWTWVLRQHAVEPFIERYNYLTLLMIFASFFMQLCFVFFFKDLYQRSILYLLLYIFIMLELGGTVFLCLLYSEDDDIKYSLIVMIVTIIMSVVISKFNIRTPRETNVVIQWALRYYLMSSIVALLMNAFDRTEFEMTIALIMYSFLIVYVIVFGITVGSLDFFSQTGADGILLGVMFYFVCACTFSLGVSFFKKYHMLAADEYDI